MSEQHLLIKAPEHLSVLIRIALCLGEGLKSVALCEWRRIGRGQCVPVHATAVAVGEQANKNLFLENPFLDKPRSRFR